MEIRAIEGESPVALEGGCQRVVLFDESRSLGIERKLWRYNSPNAKYDWVADSKQVARAKDEKDLERGVK